MCKTHGPKQEVQQSRRNGSATSWQGRLYTPKGCVSSGMSNRVGCFSFEELAGYEHGMHYHRKLAGDGHSSALEADFLAQFDPPSSQITFRRGTRHDDCCRFVEKAAQMSVTKPQYMAIIIDLAW